MKFLSALALCLVASSTQVTPIEKVLELLGTMLEKSKTAKHAEVLQWTAYKQWCSDTELDKQSLVKRADARIDMLKASIEKLEAEIARLAKEIEDHEADIVSDKAQIAKATEARAAAHVDYTKLSKDYTETIVAIEQATKVLKEQDYSRPQAASLLQIVAAGAHVPEATRKVIKAFVQQAPELDVRAPEANAYEFQSSGILEILKNLLDKFTEERHALDKEEMTQKHAFESLAQDLTNQIAASENEISKKTQRKAETQRNLADDQAGLGETSTARASDAKYLEDLDATCNSKMTDFGSRQELRAEEVESLEKAISIVSGASVSGAADKHLRQSTAPAAAATSLAQVPHKSPATETSRVAAYLQDAARRTGSSVLAVLAQRARDDPFGKVKKLIQDLLNKLQAEARDEADHKAWCDSELDANLQTRTTKTAEVDALHSKIDGLKSDIAVLFKDIALLSKAVAQLQSEMAQATKLYEAERATNQDTVADAVAGQESVGEAITILQDFYGKAAGATAFAQQPAIFDAAYKGHQLDNDNVIAFLQVIHSDFARLETTTSAAIAAAESEYNSFMDDSNADVKQKDADTKQKQGELLAKQQDLEDSSEDLEAAQTQLDTALAYFDKLKPSCIGGGRFSDYKERVGRREEEIESLQEALKILSGETPVDTGPEALYSSVDGGNLGSDTGIQGGTQA